MTAPVRLAPKPGIQRDGTVFDSDAYIDGLWMRFYRGRPKKMGGYRMVSAIVPSIVNSLSAYTAQNSTYLHMGSLNNVFQTVVDQFGVSSGVGDRTPAGLVSIANRLWQFAVLYDSAGGGNYVIAHGPPNLNDISNETETAIYYGDVQSTARLTDTGVTNESGGIVAVAPYLFKFGNNGHVAWSAPNKPNDFSGSGSGEAWVTPAKIVRGLPLRSGGQGPAAIFWSLDTLIRGSFVGSSNGYWAFDSLATEISVLSPASIIDVDGTYYWLGVDRALMFNGVVREVKNDFNMDWFFKNLNMDQRMKVYAFRVPRYGEIWWCFPMGNATECTHAIIYNVREGIWYDTELPEGGRSAGIYANVVNKPFMMGVQDSSGYTLWQHEVGVNKQVGPSVYPVTAHFETNEISMIGLPEGAQDVSLRVVRVESDFLQAGDLELTINGRANARAPNIASPVRIIPATASNWEEQTTPLKETRRLMSFKFRSNVVDGDFYMGRTLVHLAPSDGRQTQ